MTVWFTSDLHLGHANIISYSRRPFPDVVAMNQGLIDRWNDAVGSADDVWVLGDFALGRIETTLPLVRTLHGRKQLVSGNHDRCWSGHGSRAAQWIERYLDAGFHRVHQGDLGLDVAGIEVRGCHFPYIGDSHDHDRYVEARPVDRGQWLLHGHVHERWRQRGRMINVGVDAWDYRPVSAGALGELIAAGPAERPPVERVPVNRR
ncbi:MAG: metallophosphoesterase family protein [Actinomycetota bacterium]|nr:metallophosphoesterase family protein [Actinomycetota bacterium]MDQ6948574.1 metallophosphoesterase family protein [Actinomycetota bacterium]